MIANMVYSDVALLFHILHECNDLKKLADYVFLYSKVIIMTLRTLFDIKKLLRHCAEVGVWHFLLYFTRKMLKKIANLVLFLVFLCVLF
jgi:hypothetical protein